MPTQPENPGLRLLKKGQKGLIHAVFSRLGLIVLLFLLQLVLLFAIFSGSKNSCPTSTAWWSFSSRGWCSGSSTTGWTPPPRSPG